MIATTSKECGTFTVADALTRRREPTRTSKTIRLLTPMRYALRRELFPKIFISLEYVLLTSWEHTLLAGYELGGQNQGRIILNDTLTTE